ncbi:MULTISPECIES: ATP-binding protein [unclassified Mesorhizobium]|uniref:ATP-binding protein n=1 Tax=unclassified Mesorhizobium TaxID=325217 RepID=UPI000BAFB795|nr:MULTISPECIES: ATP-binding protein [unclassified Mesorhizobium]PBB23274.1 hypothetical protein CK232_28615 [Mesorhizobium sp. WSM4304]PBB71844.1 hypothetical protein CK227_29895 [Mesorhizobium sp. WSM4308]
MPSLTENIENRVRKLTKPSNNSQGLQPLFEAVSNAFFAIEDRQKLHSEYKGRVDIRIEHLSDPKKIAIEVEDNGIGLDGPRYEAFCTVDTDFKKSKGGKGVGRLFWLDAFNSIRVESSYDEEGVDKRRAFHFELGNSEQIVPETPKGQAWAKYGTLIQFVGLRGAEYVQYFPRRADTFLRYFTAHFIADFLMGSGPEVIVQVGDHIAHYPKEVSDLVVGKPLKLAAFEHEDFGTLSIVGFVCKPEASTGLDGNHQLHLLADGRTVESRKIDNLLGLRDLSAEGEVGLFFHGCVTGEYLDKRVNEGRTAFNIPEKTLKDLTRHCVEQVKAKFFPTQLAGYLDERRQSFEAFVSRHPIYGFDDTDVQLDRVPFHATEPEDFAAGLVKYQIRRDESRSVAMQGVINQLDSPAAIPANFSEVVSKAATEIHDSEKLALAQHVVRRKLVLELVDKMIRRVRQRDGREDDYHLERSLHSLIVPMGIRGDDHNERKSRAHDLWIVDERLAFTRAFSSDKRLDAILREGGTDVRADLIVWDLAYGLGVTDPEKSPDQVDISEPLRKMMIVEFKRPGRKEYKGVEDQIEAQIIKYLSQLKSGEIESFSRERIRVADDCIFYCYVVADIEGDLVHQLSAWQTTANGQGRIRPLQNAYRGSIEVVQWRDLINDAWLRNQATISAAGLSRNAPILDPDKAEVQLKGPILTRLDTLSTANP